jgi:DNA-binding transcriptional MocR family regulator
MDTTWANSLPNAQGPKYLVLARLLREAIRSGALSCGEQLPTVRELGYLIHVTPGTVARAYQIVTQEGLIQATVGRGTFVAAQTPRLGPTQPMFAERDATLGPGLLDLRYPALPDVGQVKVFSDTMIKVAGQVGLDWLDYTRQSDEGALRSAVVKWLSHRVLGPIKADDVMLNYGGQNGIDLVMSCCLRGDRPVVLTEELAYPGFRYAARLSRADVVGIEMDEQGILPAALEAACLKHGPQMLCVTPETQNPTTVKMSLARQAEIVAIARTYDLQIIEDECYASTLAEGPTLRALAPERVWYTGSFSKTISASFRFGFVICPTGMGNTGRLTAQHSFFSLARPVSALCLELLESGDAAVIREAVQQEVRLRLAIMVNQLGAFNLSWRPGMPFVWLRLPLGWRASTFARKAE